MKTLLFLLALGLLSPHAHAIDCAASSNKIRALREALDKKAGEPRGFAFFQSKEDALSMLKLVSEFPGTSAETFADSAKALKGYHSDQEARQIVEKSADSLAKCRTSSVGIEIVLLIQATQKLQFSDEEKKQVSEIAKRFARQETSGPNDLANLASVSAVLNEMANHGMLDKKFKPSQDKIKQALQKNAKTYSEYVQARKGDDDMKTWADKTIFEIKMLEPIRNQLLELLKAAKI